MASIQVAPQQSQPSIGPGSYTLDPSPNSRHQYQQSPPATEQPRSPSNNRGSPHSSRRPSRRPSGNTTQPGTSDHPQAVSGPDTPRVPNIPATHASPIAPMASSSPSYDPQRSRREQRAQNVQPGGPPISPPPRTSSTQRSQAGGMPLNAPLVDRITQQPNSQTYDDRPSGSRRAKNDQQPAMGSPPVSSPDTATSTRRRGPTSSQGPQRAISTKEPNAQHTASSGQSRHTHNSAVPPANSRPPPQDGQVIDRIVLDDPVVDLQRENERQAEAIPGPSIANTAPPATSSADTPRSRQDFSNSAKRKEVRFGEYILGQTLGEGEFGKVKLGWKTDGSVQVAIKLIRLESLEKNPTRKPKIDREIRILRELNHPNIVRLHERIETDHFIGMVLEYASGGELFDYILTHRYLKDNTARKLFAQLVSGVGYLHKKGIVHRDLKLENLLLDKNRNIIITDFGFANTFEPSDELGEEIEYHLADRDFVKKMDLERVRSNGSRRGDLMATSCGSPCYAAPELVVTDSLYTGRKVDVWSCGVILYAMLAGYLPFDDDPENPDGDNINQLYKYITSTPLTFPEYVTPHARDLLRRILLADPRKRADLFEVARHSWLSDFAHVVAQVTSSTTTLGDIASTTATADAREVPGLVRSHSVREPAKAVPSNMSPVGGLSHQGKIDPMQPTERTEPPRDSKRRTVQVEYVAPQRQTTRGEAMPTISSPGIEGSATVAPAPSQNRARAGTEGPTGSSRQYPPTTKPLPQDPRQKSDKTYHRQPSANRSSQSPVSTQRDMAPPQRPPKDLPRSVSDSTGAFGQAPTSTGRPNTGGSMTSTGQGRLPSRGNSYSQPLAPTVAATNAQGRVTQPKSENRYNISAPMPIPEPYVQGEFAPRPVTQHYGSPPAAAQHGQTRSHKRSNTFGNFFRTGSISGPPRSQPQSPAETPQPKEKRYPPMSMKNPLPAENTPRQSMESRRPSFSFTRKCREDSESSKPEKQEKSRRFSLLPASFSLKSFTSAGNGKDGSSEYRPASERKQPNAPAQPPPSRGQSRPQTMSYQKPQNVGHSYRQEADDAGDFDGQRDEMAGATLPQSRRNDYLSRDPIQSHQSPYGGSRQQKGRDDYPPPRSQPVGPPYLSTPNGSELSIPTQQYQPVYPPGFGSEAQVDPPRKSTQQARPARGPAVLTKNNRRFADAYNQEQEPSYGSGHHAGSSGAAKRVMDFFRRRGKARVGEDRE